MAAPPRCPAGHERSSRSERTGSCPSCRMEAVAATVAAADPSLPRDAIVAAIGATVTSPAVLRELAVALAEGPAVLRAGAPSVVGRLVGALVARGSGLPLPSCSVCRRTDRPLIRVGTTGVCPRCRQHQSAQACSRCGVVRPVSARDGERQPLCFRCAPKPMRPCGICGHTRPVARRARDGNPDVCVNCFELPLATCERCGRCRPCNFVAAGHPTCSSCSPRRVAPCAHCGIERPPCARWPEGPVCEPCYRAAHSRRGACEGCGDERRLVFPPGPEARLCCDCAGVPPLARCRDCGAEERLHAHGRCSRCALRVRATGLLSDASGVVPPSLRRLHASIAGARQPYSALNWLRGGAGAAIVAEIASGELAATHEALDAHPNRRAADHLRQVLVANGVLPERHEGLARLEGRINEALAGVAREEDRRLLRAYATWGVLGRLRRRAGRGEVVRTRVASIRLRAAVVFLAWLEGRGIALAGVRQPDLETWLAADPPSSYDVAHFLRWAAERGLVGRLEVPRLGSRRGTALDDERRWAIVERLLHDAALDLADRVAGCLVLLYGQQLTRILALTVDRVAVQDDGVHLNLGREEVLVPEPLGALLVELVATGRRYVGVGSPAETVWLFPGLLAGRALTPARLGQRLGKLGIDGRAGRHAALLHLAARLPAAVLAELLNVSPGTAVRWMRAAGGDWSSYAAQVARERDHRRC